MNTILNKRGMAFISILITLLIIGAMYYWLMKSNNTKGMKNSNKSFIEGAGINTSNYKSILDSTKEVVKDAQKRQ